MNTEPEAQSSPAGPSTAERSRLARVTREAWRELGFWYECDFPARCWRLRADRQGLRRLAEAVRLFLSSPEADEIGEHLHLGPYSNLRIIRSDHAWVGWRGIGGRREDLERFVAELEALAATGAAGTYGLCSSFVAEDDGFRVLLVIEPDGFDPATSDPTVSGEPAS